MRHFADHSRTTTPLTDAEQQWLARMKQTIALDISRAMTAGIPPKGIVELLFRIPEVAQAFEMRAKGPPKD